MPLCCSLFFYPTSISRGSIHYQALVIQQGTRWLGRLQEWSEWLSPLQQVTVSPNLPPQEESFSWHVRAHLERTFPGVSCSQVRAYDEFPTYGRWVTVTRATYEPPVPKASRAHPCCSFPLPDARPRLDRAARTTPRGGERHTERSRDD